MQRTPLAPWFKQRMSRSQRSEQNRRKRNRRPDFDAFEPRLLLSFNGAIYTSNSTGDVVNANLFDNISDVYLNGGPQNNKGSGLPDGTYYFQVTTPDGKLLSTDYAVDRQLQVVDGVVFGAEPFGTHMDGSINPHNGSKPVQLAPFNVTTNAGGEYKVWLITEDSNAHPDANDPRVLDFDESDAKTDNFKVKNSGGNPQINQAIDGIKYNDANGDGVFDDGDTPLAGVTITVVATEPGVANPVTLQTVTNVLGQWGLVFPEGTTYVAQETVPTGWTQTGPLPGSTILHGSNVVASANGNMAWTGTVDANETSGLNFFNFQNLLTISGHKYEDVNGDDTTSIVGDTPLAGWKIDITGPGGYSATATTGADGSYSFPNLGPGTYHVSEETNSLPGTWTQTFGKNGYDVTLQASDAGPYDFANFKDITISGTKYNDGNGDDGTNGVGGSDDSGLGGVTIILTDSSNHQTQTTTGPDGTYSFGPLGPGTYTVTEDVPDGWTQTFGTDGHTVIAHSGQDSTGNDFANFQDITISGTKYNDGNGDDGTNGVNGADDSPLGGVIIILTDSSNHQTQTTTKDDGTYSFPDVGPGSYTITEIVPDGWTQTFGTDGHTVIAHSGQDSTGNDFANFQDITISGTKYNDGNGDDGTNGVNGADDSPLGGVIIVLTGLPDGPITTQTKDDGTYSFGPLGPGTYTVTEDVPDGWTQTFGTDGHTVIAHSGQDSTGNDFANFQDITISGTKYKDGNGDDGTQGVAGSDDSPLGGVTIVLTGLPDGPITTQTKDDGTYSFGPLGPGTYTVTEDVPDGWTQTFGTDGHTVIAHSGQDSTGNDFANFQNVTLSGFKFQDMKGDDTTKGIGSDDVPLGGWTIFLTDASNHQISATTQPDGSYSFANVGPGTYTITENLPNGWTQTFGNGGYSQITTHSGVNQGPFNFANFQNISISGLKFHDHNGDGIQQAGDEVLSGWTIQLFVNGGSSPVDSRVTGTGGMYSFTNLGPGTYTVKEVQQTGWVQTLSPPPVIATSGTNATNENFGNAHLGQSGGLTLGFWSNKNGQALITSADLSYLSSLNLRNADGSNFDPGTAKQLSTWLTNASATNMANMLSAQLAANVLNVRHGFYSTSTVVYVPGLNTWSGNTQGTKLLGNLNSGPDGTLTYNGGFVSIGTLITEANNLLASNGNIGSSSTLRLYAEALKIVFDGLNNNQPIILI